MIFAVAPCRAGETSPVYEGFIASWLAMVSRTQDEQPHWITPLATGTPRLEQEFRLDMFSEVLPTHGHLNNYGAGKGLDLVLAETYRSPSAFPLTNCVRQTTVKLWRKDGGIGRRSSSSIVSPAPMNSMAITSLRDSCNSAFPPGTQPSPIVSTSFSRLLLSAKDGAISTFRRH